MPPQSGLHGHAAEALGAAAPGPLLHDLIDVGRQALAVVPDRVHAQLKQTADHGNATAAQELLDAMNMLIIDMDNLVGTDVGFLLGPWLDTTKENGHTAA